MWYDIRRIASREAVRSLEAAFHATLSAKFPATFERCRMRCALDHLAAEAPTLLVLPCAANSLLILFVRNTT